MKREKMFFTVMLVLLLWALTVCAEEALMPYYVQIESLTTDLRVQPGTSGGADADADFGQEHTVTVYIENVNDFPIDTVCVELAGGVHTVVNGNLVADTLCIPVLGAYGDYEFDFTVSANIVLKSP